MARRELAEGDEPEGREVGDRLVHVPGQLGQIDRRLVEADLDLVVVGADPAGDTARVGELVDRPLPAEADREGRDRAGRVAGHHGDDQARVETAAQHRAEGDVGHEAEADGLVQLVEERLGHLPGVAGHGIRRRGGVRPVALDPVAVGIHDQAMARLELAHLAQRGRRRGEESEGEIGVDRLVVQLVPDQPGGEEALELGGEDEEVPGDRVVQRLDPQTVAHQDRAAAVAIPEDDAEHPAELLGERRAEALVEVRKDLGIATTVEAVTAVAEVPPDALVVEQLTVLCGPDRAVLVGERLVPSLDVDDAQTPHPDCDPGLEDRPPVAGTAMAHRVRHAIEDVRLDDLPRRAGELDDAADSAHGGRC